MREMGTEGGNTGSTILVVLCHEFWQAPKIPLHTISQQALYSMFKHLPCICNSKIGQTGLFVYLSDHPILIFLITK